MNESPTSGEGQQTPTELNPALFAEIKHQLAQVMGGGFGDGCEDCGLLWAVKPLVAEVERLRSQLDDARGKAARLEQELDDKRQTVLALHVGDETHCIECGSPKPCATVALFAGPSSVAEFEALGTPVEDKK